MNDRQKQYYSNWLEKLKAAANSEFGIYAEEKKYEVLQEIYNAGRKNGYDDCIEIAWDEEMKELLRAAKPE